MKAGALALAFVISAGLAACGSGHGVSAHTAPTRSQAYLKCEKAANVARSLLAYAQAGFAPGNVDRLIASSSEQAATQLRQGSRQIGSDRSMALPLEQAATGLAVLARRARGNHQTMPTAILQGFGSAKADVDSLCPPTT